MLQIKQKLLNFKFNFPRLNFSAPKPLEFSPDIEDNDKLMIAIEDDPITQENDWELEEHPSTESLEEFWSEVQADITSDPTWFKFAEEE